MAPLSRIDILQHDKLVTSVDWAPKSNRIVTCSQDVAPLPPKKPIKPRSTTMANVFSATPMSGKVKLMERGNQLSSFSV